MNKEVLVVINWYDNNIDYLKEAIKRLEEVFSNIIVNNKSNKIIDLDKIFVVNGHSYNYLNEINDYIQNKKLDIKSIVFVEDIINTTRDDIAKCALDAIKNNNIIFTGINDDYVFGEKIINKLFNVLFNTNFKSIMPDIKTININLFKHIIANNNLQNNGCNYLINAISENIPIKEENIKTIWRKNEKRVGRSRFKAILYLKNLLPYIVKAIIPYFISLILFIIIFYIRKASNDLEGIIIATTVSEGVGILLHIFINYQMVYRNNLIYRNILFLLKKIFRIVISCFLVYIFYNIFDLNLIISKLVIDFILMIFIACIFSLLYEN